MLFEQYQFEYTFTKKKKKTRGPEFPLCPAVINPTGIREDAGSIHGLTLWLDDLALLWAAVLVTDAARIPHCCGCVAGWWLQLWFDPYHGNFHMPQVGPKKKQNKTKKTKTTCLIDNFKVHYANFLKKSYFSSKIF